MKKLNIKPLPPQKSDAFLRGYNSYCTGFKNPYEINHKNHSEFENGLLAASKENKSIKHPLGIRLPGK